MANFTSWTVRCTEEFPQKLRVAAVEAQVTQGRLLEQLLDEKLDGGSWWLQSDEPNEDVRLARRQLIDVLPLNAAEHALVSIAYSLLALAQKP